MVRVSGKGTKNVKMALFVFFFALASKYWVGFSLHEAMTAREVPTLLFWRSCCFIQVGIRMED